MAAERKRKAAPTADVAEPAGDAGANPNDMDADLDPEEEYIMCLEEIAMSDINALDIAQMTHQSLLNEF